MVGVEELLTPTVILKLLVVGVAKTGGFILHKNKGFWLFSKDQKM